MTLTNKYSILSLFLRIAACSLALTSPACASSSPPVTLQSRQLTQEQKDKMSERLEEIGGRLNLTEEQQSQLQPILRESFEKKMAILDRYGVSRNGGSRPSIRQLRAMRSELDAVQNKTDSKMFRILDSRQMSEYKKIQEENREAIRQRIISRR